MTRSYRLFDLKRKAERLKACCETSADFAIVLELKIIWIIIQ